MLLAQRKHGPWRPTSDSTLAPVAILTVVHYKLKTVSDDAPES
jgi:hypothetical protein